MVGWVHQLMVLLLCCALFVLMSAFLAGKNHKCIREGKYMLLVIIYNLKASEVVCLLLLS